VPAVALSGVGASVVESGPVGQNLAAGTWQRLDPLPDPLPDPRSPQGLIHPLACMIAVAVCAAGTTGSPRSAVDQAGWPGRPGPAARAVGPEYPPGIDQQPGTAGFGELLMRPHPSPDGTLDWAQ
jgi:hypothetical protein